MAVKAVEAVEAVEVVEVVNSPSVRVRRKQQYSKPYFEQSVEFKTDVTLQLTFGLIPNVMYSFFSLDVILYYIGEADFAEKVNERANELLDKELNRFNGLLDRIKDLAAKNEVLTLPKYTITKNKTFRQYTPLATKFLNIVKVIEEYNNWLDALWLNGHIHSEYRNLKNKKLKTNLFIFSRQMANLGVNSMAVAQDKGLGNDIKQVLSESDYKPVDVDTDEQNDELTS